MAEPVVQRDCTIPEASAQYLVFPVNENTRTYANGDIRFLHLNTFGEPAAGASHLLVSFRSPSEPTFHCTIISLSEGVGFSDVELLAATSKYDPDQGLSVLVPVRVFDGEQFVDRVLAVTVDRASGNVASKLDTPHNLGA